MNTISTLTLRRMSYGVLLLAILMMIPATADACACCAEPGTWFQETARADPEVLAIVGELGGRLEQTASLYLTAAGLEELKGISPVSETYTLRRIRPHTRDWKLEFIDQRGDRGTLAFTIPDAVVYYGADLHDGQQASAGGPLLYKEWRFEGPVVGTGIFRGGAVRGAKFRIIFQARGNMCRNADDFKSWVLQVRGGRADYAFYGSISPRAEQSDQVGIGANVFAYDALNFELGSLSLRQNEHFILEPALFLENRRPAVTARMAFNTERPIELLTNHAKYGGPSTLIQPDNYGSISYSQSRGRFGSAWGLQTRSEAEERALASCNSSDCRVLLWFRNSCGALARARNGALEWSSGRSLVEAKNQAANRCTRRWGSCKLICSVCSRGDVP